MNLIEKLSNFFKYIFYRFRSLKKSKFVLVEGEDVTQLEEGSSGKEDRSEDIPMIGEIDDEDGRINVSKRTLITKLYILEQEIEFFKYDFPNEYTKFLEQIKCIKEEYINSLKSMSNKITFEIDPETDGSKVGDVIRLEKAIKTFINTEVKFNVLSKRLQKLIVKLNILYNTSILHSKENEKNKVISQIKHAISAETFIAKELKECDFIFDNNQLRERLITLISYIDYEIFKTSLRNSSYKPDELIKELVLSTEFKNFDFSNAFKAFINDELSDLDEITYFITEEVYQRDCRKKISKLLQEITYSGKDQDKILDPNFWNRVFILESSMLELLKRSGVDKEKARIKVLDKLEINVAEDEVLALPKTNAYISLANVFSTTQDTKILLLIKLLKELSDEITYKEIYFLVILFDSLEVIKNAPNGLIRYIEKYLNKYPYNSSAINKKKEYVINSLSNKEYVFAFSLEDDEDNVIKALENLNMDFQLVNNDVYISSFYFIGLENVISSLKNNTQRKITT